MLQATENLNADEKSGVAAALMLQGFYPRGGNRISGVAGIRQGSRSLKNGYSNSTTTVKTQIIEPLRYVVGVVSSGKVWCFFVFLWLSGGLSSSVFAVFFASITSA